MDEDIKNMTVEELQQETMKLRSGIRTHRDQKGDENCWLDDQMYLYGMLPEKIGADPELPSKELMMVNCSRYYECRKQGKLYKPLDKLDKPEVKVNENFAKGQSNPEYVTGIFNIVGIEEEWTQPELGKWISSERTKRDKLEEVVQLIKVRTVQNVKDHQEGEEAVEWINDFLDHNK
jgi:hypothetical protein